ncbi:MAG: hypothetical protein ACLGGV_01155 [Bacteroidia bacterium]
MKTLKLTFLLNVLTLSFVHAQLENSIRLTVTDPKGITDETVIRLNPQATKGYDGDWDAWKFFSYNNNHPGLYTSLSDETEALSINSFKLQNKDTVVQVMLRAKTESGTYTLSVEFLGEMNPAMKIGLREVSSNQKHFLENGYSFNFNHAASSNDVAVFVVNYSFTPLHQLTNGDLELVKKGVKQWHNIIEDEQGDILVDELYNEEEIFLQNLPSGNYTLTSMDDFGFEFLTQFVVDNGSTVSVESTKQTSISLVKTEFGYLLSYIPANTLSATVAVFDINGKLLFNKEILSQESMSFNLPQGISYVKVYNQSINRTFNIMN